MQIVASIGGSKLEIISSEWPVMAINARVQMIDTPIMRSGRIIVFNDRKRIYRVMQISASERTRYFCRFFWFSLM
jgi:hypothetical protein